MVGRNETGMKELKIHDEHVGGNGGPMRSSRVLLNRSGRPIRLI